MSKILGLYFIIQSCAFANYISDNVESFKWKGIDVTWIKDNALPTYEMMVYFAEGSIGESKNLKGSTEFMFNELSSGTTRYSQSEILAALEFYGTSFGANVTHEFSTYSVSGLVKDMEPSFKMVCHMFNNATFPKNELAKSKRRAVDGIKKLVTNHGALASRIFREVSLSDSAFNYPVSGKIRDIKKLKPSELQSRLTYLNQKVKKRIYIKGPKSVLKIKGIIEKDCNWSQGKMVKSFPYTKRKSKNKPVYLVTVPKANQAQIRIGRILTRSEVSSDQARMTFASKFLGGGFTSRLMQEVRVKRGLTYSIGAYASGQRDYGRSGISTFTKNVTLAKTLSVIKDTIESSSTSITNDQYSHSKRFLKGNYLLGLESSSDFMNSLMYLDHQGRSYSELYEFPSEIEKVSKEGLAAKIKELYNFDEQIVLILGSRNLKKQLEKSGYNVKVISYKKYL